jgi:phosphatidate cytidylyltransferase
VLWPPGFPLMGALMTAFVAVAPVVMGQERFLESFSITVTGAVYPTGLLASLVALREARGPAVDADGAFWLVLLTFFLVWATDIFAYYVGRAVGRTPLAPTISPNKTWEGSLGGFAAAALVAVGFKLTVLGVLGWDDVAALAVLGGAVSQVGDLAESQLKRSTGADDAGAILPGHGGVFDRFDAMVVAAPLIYLYLRYAAQLF